MAAGSDKFGDAAAAAADGGGDLYAVLGLKKECTDAELKVAYKKLAMRWHPDKCLASGSSKRVEEAKEKFQEIQGAYSVLSDSNKRFLYDVGVYDSEDDDDDDNLQGMGDFLGEMAQMMSQSQPTGNGRESFEELQRLFVDMFQADLDEGFCSGPWAQTRAQAHTPSPSPSSSPSPPPPPAAEAEAPSWNGVNKHGCSAMNSGKPPRPGEAGSGQNGFCFGGNGRESFEELQRLFVDMFQADLDEGFCSGPWAQTRAQARTPSPSPSSFPSPPPPAAEAEAPSWNGVNKRGCSAMNSGKPPRPGEAGSGQNEFCFGKRDSRQQPKSRGGSTSKRRNGRKQKVSSKHDVSSADAEVSAA